MKRQIAKQTLTTLAIAAVLGSAVAPAQAYGWTSEQKRRLAFGIASGSGWYKGSGVTGILKTWDAQANWYGGDYSQVLINACGLTNTELSTVAPTWDPQREFLAAAAYIRGGSGTNVPAADCAWRWKLGTVNAQLNTLMKQRAALPQAKKDTVNYRQQQHFIKLNAARDMRAGYQYAVKTLREAQALIPQVCGHSGPTSSSCLQAKDIAFKKQINVWMQSANVITTFVRAAEHLHAGVSTVNPGYLAAPR